MLSRPFALALVAAACVVAAGGGAYIATLQQAHSEPVEAAGQAPSTPTITPVPAPPTEPSADAGASSAAGEGPADAPAPRLEPADAAKPKIPQVDRQSRVQPRSSRPGARDVRSRPSGADAPAAAGRADVPSGSEQAAAPPPQIPAPAVVPSPVDAEARAQEPAWRELTVPADTVLGLQLESSLSSETARVEDEVEARVTRDVRVDGHVAIPAGTRAVGSVVAVERGGKIRDRARLGIRFHTLILPDATRLQVPTGAIYREGESPAKSSSAKIGGGAIGGAILGTILGGGKGAAIGGGIGAAGGTAAAMAGGRHAVTLRAGTPLSVRTDDPVTVTVEK